MRGQRLASVEPPPTTAIFILLFLSTGMPDGKAVRYYEANPEVALVLAEDPRSRYHACIGADDTAPWELLLDLVLRQKDAE
jgi:hypothetical protein